ncbi:ABC transporter permease [Clostridiales bacterium COT073_COT-073]|nr:ABC transporter permease [Clostridiales bacterium COT073_COT-073]
MKKIKFLIRYNDFPFGIYILLILMVATFLIFTKGTVSPMHLLNIARAASPLGIVAIGQTLTLLVAGLDLSLGTQMSLVNLVLASMMNGNSDKTFVAILISLTLCAFIGMVNGIVITKFKMQPFLVTMAMSLIIQGGYYIYTKGIARGSIAREIRYLSEGWIGNIPVALILWIALWLICSVILKKTVYGQKLYMAGANKKASDLSGFRSDRIIISAYVLAALLAGIAGILLSAYIGVASVDIGNSYTLDSVAASVIGGTSFLGGVGSLEGTFPGVLIITILSSLMTIIGISEAGKFICQGTIIAVMVALSQLRTKERR